MSKNFIIILFTITTFWVKAAHLENNIATIIGDIFNAAFMSSLKTDKNDEIKQVTINPKQNNVLIAHKDGEKTTKYWNILCIQIGKSIATPLHSSHIPSCGDSTCELIKNQQKLIDHLKNNGQINQEKECQAFERGQQAGIQYQKQRQCNETSQALYKGILLGSIITLGTVAFVSGAYLYQNQFSY